MVIQTSSSKGGPFAFGFNLLAALYRFTAFLVLYLEPPYSVFNAIRHSS